MPELSVFTIEQDDATSTLTKLVESLRQDATGYSPGLAVNPDSKIPGLYRLEEHRGTITDNTYPVRIVENKVLTKRGAGKIEQMLRAAKVPFQRYDHVNIPEPASVSLQINLSERKPNLIYNPAVVVI